MRFSSRIFQFATTLAFALVLAFVLMRSVPGDPTDRLMSVTTQDDIMTNTAGQWDSLRTIWRHRLGLDQPVFYLSLESLNKTDHHTLGYWIPVINFHADNQFHRWLFGDGVFSKGILRGDFGISYATRQPVAQLLRNRLVWSVGLTLFSMALAFLIAIPLALRAARKKDQLIDRVVRSMSLTLLSLPTFWLAVVLLTLFANASMLNWLPASGTGPLDESEKHTWLDSLPYLILPVLTYTLGMMGYLLRSIRDAAVEEVQSDYARTAAAKGQDDVRIMKRHVLRNLLPYLVTLASFALPAALSGAVLLETIFGIPGMGNAIQDAVTANDYPVLSAVFLLSALVTLLGFAVSDFIIARIDPRTMKRGPAQ